MRLLISNNSKELRQFLKSLSHTFDCYQGTKKQKKVYLFVTNQYLSLVNQFLINGIGQTKLCLCNISSQIFKVDPFLTEENGIIYKIDADSFLKIINSHVESEICQLQIVLPVQKENHSMEVTYDTTEGIRCSFALNVQIEEMEWPFENGKLSMQVFQPETTVINFLQIPPKYIKSIEYIKGYHDVWFCLTPECIRIKKIEGQYIVDEQKLMNLCQNYDYNSLCESLRGNTAICMKCEPFFRHLEVSTRENLKTLVKIAVTFDFHEPEKVVHGFMILETIGQKKHIIEGFQVAIRTEVIQNHSMAQEKVNRKTIILSDKDAKRQEVEPQVSLNRFYGRVREEEYTRRFAEREADESRNEFTMPKKFKIQL